MTAYESLLWTYWLPKVRSAINNIWHPSNPQPAVDLYRSWAPLLPTFISDNVLDQLILPKIRAAMADWSPRSSEYSLHGIVFPWLEHAGPRMDEILEEAKRRLKSWLKVWRPRDGVPQGFAIWQDVYSAGEWDSLMLKTVLPALGLLLRDKFVINPRNQNMDALNKTLAWRPYLRLSMIDQLLELEFFPKWLDALYIWLTSATTDYDQVTQWYSWWKSWFHQDLVALPGIKGGFAKGLELMNNALTLGEDAQYRCALSILSSSS